MRYTKDNDLTDSLINEERIYDENGNLVLFQQSPSDYPKTTYVWKYYYDKNGLKSYEAYFQNGEPQYKKIYKYNLPPPQKASDYMRHPIAYLTFKNRFHPKPQK